MPDGLPTRIASIPEDDTALVLVADVVASRSLATADRRALQEWLRVQGGEALAFRFTGGDEFEWRLPATGESLDRLLAVRAALAAGTWGGPHVLLRYALGVGAVDLCSPDGPYSEDGPAYHRARWALKSLEVWGERRVRRRALPFEPGGGLTALTAARSGVRDPVLDALLLQMDGQLLRWTQAQWQVIALLLQGLTQATIGEQLGISQPAVAARLRAADIDRYLAAHQAVRLKLVGEGTLPPDAP